MRHDAGHKIFLGQDQGLPEAVMKWAGLRGDLGEYDVDDSSRSLADHNDSGNSFNAIADLIEAHPDKVFK